MVSYSFIWRFLKSWCSRSATSVRETSIKHLSVLPVRISSEIWSLFLVITCSRIILLKNNINTHFHLVPLKRCHSHLFLSERTQFGIRRWPELRNLLTNSRGCQLWPILSNRESVFLFNGWWLGRPIRSLSVVLQSSSSDHHIT